MSKKNEDQTGRKKGKASSMRVKNSGQLDLNLGSRGSDTPKTAYSDQSLKGAHSARVYRIGDSLKKREQVEEGKHIRAILDLVRHYK
jgi:hypothetical protein